MMVLTRRNMSLFVRYRDAASDNERARLLAELCADEVKGLESFFWQHRHRSLRSILRELKVHPAAVGQVARVIFDTPRKGIVDNDSESLIGISVLELEARIRNGYLYVKPGTESEAPSLAESPKSAGPLPEWMLDLPSECLQGHFRKTLDAWVTTHAYNPLIYRMRDAHIAIVAKQLGIRITSVRNNISRIRMLTHLPTPANYPPIDEQFAEANLAEALADALERLKVYDREREIIDHLLIRLGVTEGSFTARIKQALEAAKCPRNCACGRDAGTDANAG